MISNYSSPSSNGNAELIRVVMPLVLLLVVIIVIKKVFDGIGDSVSDAGAGLNLIDSKEEKKAQKVADDANSRYVKNPFSNPFDRALYRQGDNWDGAKYGNLSTAEATKAAKYIAGSEKTFAGVRYAVTTDRIKHVLNQLNSQVQVSFLAEIFQKTQGKRLWDYMRSIFGQRTGLLSDANLSIELAEVIKRVEALPLGFKGKPNGKAPK